ncbi:MAG: dihydropteroate synthase [Pseudoflavonifractor sp.]|nr:dihydropteroate synthase [Alloprevotella sp.]MCM1116756.1 dihydropteroate synthase [Pseudoflavonifractor sp.]
MDTSHFHPFSIRLGSRLLCFDKPAVMGILNATPDSFHPLSRAMDADAVARRVEMMVAQGADLIDVGGCSTRPGAPSVSEQEETDRLGEAMRVLRSVAPDIPVSIDTFRASVARNAISQMGADIINDISGGDLDPLMFATVASLQVPYIMMHMRGNPETMLSLTDYSAEGGVAAAVASSLLAKARKLALEGVADVIADPGLGFAKTVEQNYELLNALPSLAAILERPILIGLSRKSMISRPLDITAAEALPATTALNLYALLQGASIVRVHDVAEAVQARALASLIMTNQ